MTTIKFWVELLGAFLILAVINFVFFRDDLGFIHVSQHPFWIPILLMATFYGVRSAFITACVFSAVYYGLYYVSNREALETFWSLKIIRQPLLFIGVGSLIGKVTQTLKDHLEEWKSKYDLTKKREEHFAKELESATLIKQDLERRVVSQMSTIANAYEFAKKLESFDPKELYSATLQAIIEHLDIEQASFYQVDHAKLILKSTQFKEKMIAPPPTEIHISHGMFALSISQHKALSIRDVSHELDFQTLKESPMMIAPLYRKNSSLLGCITIDKLDFRNFTPSTIKLFSMMVEWLAASIDHALYLEEIKGNNIVNDVLGFYTTSYFNQRLIDEFDRAKRYSLPLTLMLIHIKRYDDIKSSSKLALLQSLAAIIKSSIRSLDIFAQYKWEDTWAVIFPIYPEKEVKEIQKMIGERISEFAFEPYAHSEPLHSKLALEFSIATFHPKMTSEKDLVLEAEKNIQQNNGTHTHDKPSFKPSI